MNATELNLLTVAIFRIAKLEQALAAAPRHDDFSALCDAAQQLELWLDALLKALGESP